MKKQFFLGLAICLLALHTTGYNLAKAKTDKQPFSELFLTPAEKHLLLFGVVNNEFSDEVVSGLKSGLPIRFKFTVELVEEREQESIADHIFVHSLTYDTLKDSYSVIVGESNNKLIQSKNLNYAQVLMSEINGLPLIELAKLRRNTDYTMKIKAELFEKNMPENFHRVLPFLSLWDFETAWQTIEFSY